MSALRDAQATFLLNVGKLVLFATEKGFQVTAGEMWRPPEMQKIYVQTGRSKTMKSKHLDRLAVDLNFFINDAYIIDIDTLAVLGKYWESLHPKNRWGGNFDKDWTKKDSFKDVPHFEMTM